MGGDALLVVDFETAGTKRLMMRAAGQFMKKEGLSAQNGIKDPPASWPVDLLYASKVLLFSRSSFQLYIPDMGDA